jgi:hypothetical protein
MALMDAAEEKYLMDDVHQSLRDCVAHEGNGVLRRMRDAHRAGVGVEWRPEIDDEQESRNIVELIAAGASE